LFKKKQKKKRKREQSNICEAPLGASVMAGVSEALGNVLRNVQMLSSQYGKKVPRLVAVSKTKPIAALNEAYEAGQRHFGENYVKELVEKAPNMPSDVQWHFIGHLQSNKAKLIAAIPNIYMVESIDSAKLADTLNKHLPLDRDMPLKVMVQVNTSGEESKSGVQPGDCVELVRHIVGHCSKLQFVGLMTIGRLGDIYPECFQVLVDCKKEVENSGLVDTTEELELSMGMSGDYDIAIEYGTTNIRVGSTIFGSR